MRLSDAYIDGLVQERRNSSALAMELRLSHTNPLICINKHIFGTKPLHELAIICFRLDP